MGFQGTDTTAIKIESPIMMLASSLRPDIVNENGLHDPRGGQRFPSGLRKGRGEKEEDEDARSLSPRPIYTNYIYLRIVRSSSRLDLKDLHVT